MSKLCDKVVPCSKVVQSEGGGGMHFCFGEGKGAQRAPLEKIIGYNTIIPKNFTIFY
jgi:hypothetical protein